VKPRTTLSGKCHILLTEKDKEKLTLPQDDDVSEEVVRNVTEVPDSDDEVEQTAPKNTEVKEEEEEVQAKQVQVEDAPKKKRIVKKKSDE
jgi:hypothetical protein